VPDVGVALWRVGDPGNVGTLIRAADALGPAFVALSPDSADPTGPRALRASMGAVFRVPLVDLEAAPRPWIALVPAGGKTLADVAGVAKATFVLGAEREGLPAEILLRCDEVATIPLTAGADSLNVAMAGTIALYEHARSMRVEKK
jgi:TrmH family RNA methyltransferase